MLDELSGLTALVAVANKRSFTAAAAQLHVTPSAISQSVRALEERVGVRLLQRTTRSVGLTEAGERFLAQLRPAMEGVHAAFESLDAVRGRPAGTLRLSIPRLASTPVLEPILAEFLAAYPEIRLDVTVDDRLTSIVEQGFDAGIRLGEMLDKDVVAVRVTEDMRMAVVGSPAYFAARGKPRHPRELHAHDCINYRNTTSGALARWEFSDKGRDITLAVDGRLSTNDNALMLRAALDGVGLALLMENSVAEALASKRLIRVLASYCPTFPGLFLYYPSRTQLAPKLRALVDFLRARRRGGPE
ncbi:LysR family transcriptional regulator [Hyalangium rubrum]|uniref:LysR substrate-binding domain-containing protein n=1 Tax=Hyalangium rubrum TaxID=3103134 RepID=A0ABU5HIA5_9BACT|nr:LysR substrate-binding domain-containing protein [Hyalangium sp. s54d21]MDY7233198.1 LysR substrate-binding domain-containing protein [Hyalangium sp. s54d21]